MVDQKNSVVQFLGLFASGNVNDWKRKGSSGREAAAK